MSWTEWTGLTAEDIREAAIASPEVMAAIVIADALTNHANKIGEYLEGIAIALGGQELVSPVGDEIGSLASAITDLKDLLESKIE